MRNLNLAFPERTQVPFKITPFPDGQNDVTILEDHGDDPIQIMTRFNGWSDYEKVAGAVASLRRIGHEDLYLFCPYMLGGRSDRDFSKGKGGNSYLLDVVKPAVDLLDFKKVVVMDPHSDVMGAILRLRSIDNAALVQFAMDQIKNDFMVVVSPDSGSNKKIHDIIRGYPAFELVMADKHRDVQTGEFLGFHVPLLPTQVDRDLVWIDDICDGGGTFIGEALAADEMGHKGKKYLVVTHGIFSKGFSELTKHFDQIFCTNSIQNIGDMYGNSLEKTYVKQMDVFI